MSGPCLTAWIEGIGLCGPGLDGWLASREILARRQAYLPRASVLPPPSCLPPAERRRAGAAIKLALAVGSEAVAQSGREAATLASVFTASGGDGANCHAICEALAGADRLISPTRFHNSVHNAAAGYWSIAQHAMQPSTSLCAFDASFGAGLLESLCQLPTAPGGVLLVAYDTPYPEPLHATRPLPDAFGLALVLQAQRSARSCARLALQLQPQVGQVPSLSAMHEAALEHLRAAIPAARALPLLEALAAGGGERVLDYLEPHVLHLSVETLA